jgi:GxxExxY protein
MDVEQTATLIVDAAIKVHRVLGPGLLESAYQRCLQHELSQRGATVETEVLLPIRYEEIEIEAAYRIDMRVNRCVIIENKTVDNILPIHQAQLLTYLKLTNCQVGFLLNWHVPVMKQGIKRMVNGHGR